MGFLSALAGLGGAAGGFVEGEQAKQQRELQKAQTTKIQADLSESMAANIRTQLMAHPELATNPNYVKMVTHASKAYKFDLPFTPSGGIDVAAFAPPPNPLEYVKDNMGLTLPQIKEMSADQQERLAQNVPGLDKILKGPNGYTQEAQLLPSSVDGEYRNIADDIKQLGDGAITVDQLDAIGKLYEHRNPALKGAVDDIINSDVNKLAQVGRGLQEKIDRDRALGLHWDKEFDLKNMQFHSLQDYRDFMEKHYKKMEDIDERRLTERIHEDDKRNDEADARIQISRDRILKASGGEPVNSRVLQEDIRNETSYNHTLQAQLNGWRTEANRLRSDGYDVPQDLTDRMTDLQKKIDASTATLTDYKSHAKDIHDGILRGAGGTPKNPNNSNTGNTQYIKGQVYQDANGNKALWDGTKWVPQ